MSVMKSALASVADGKLAKLIITGQGIDPLSHAVGCFDVAQQAANTKLVAAKEMRTKADKMREDAEQEAGKCLELRRRRAALAGELAGARAALDEARLAAAGAEAAETEGRAVEQQE